MLVRIVRMHFTEEGVPDFLEIFNNNKQVIRNFEGCTHLELLKDINNNTTYTTLSHWKSSEHLDAYRKSELFTHVWGRVKKLFSQTPQAFSLQKLIEH